LLRIFSSRACALANSEAASNKMHRNDRRITAPSKFQVASSKLPPEDKP
jgi:hypothetical protein